MKTINTAMKMMVGVLILTGLFAGWAHAQDPSDGLVPQVMVVFPNLSTQQVKIVAPTITVGVQGLDPDSDSGLPEKVRFILIPAQYGTAPGGDPLYITTPQEFAQFGADLLQWDDPSWSEWVSYPTDGSNVQVTFPDFPHGEYFLFGTQAMDADGAVSTALGYQEEVFHFQVRADVYRPEVNICEQYLGCPQSSTIMNEIASGQPLNFSWIASADAYGGSIVSYRYGWDLQDPDDPNDPGWAGPPGLGPEYLYAPERIFQDGFHIFYLRVTDDAGQVRIINWQLSVVPYVSRDNQLELLLIDQTVDDLSQAWPDQSAFPRDNEIYRNFYWEFLAAGSGGVANFDWDRDRMDHTETPAYSDLVMYKAVLVYARNQSSQTMYGQFRPENGVDKYVWLAPYQYRGGNLFQVGGNSMDSFLEASANYMVPIIFDSAETSLVVGDDTYILGFGQRENPDGSLTARGPEMYPYATAGIAAIDWTSPSTKTIYGRYAAARYDRAVGCVGLKGLVLAPDFRAYHSVGAASIADTFFTDMAIDWQDAIVAGPGDLDLFSGGFSFRNDEFIDMNISSRTTPIIPQECPDIPEAPGGMCVEPMFTGIARMDWMREEKRDAGDTGWPSSQYSNSELEYGCGPLALTSYMGTPMSGALTNDRTFGYFSYKMIEEKPAPKADVYWGFDPYRFDQEETKKAIRWVLDYFGLPINP